MIDAKLEANTIMKNAIDAGYKVDCREECAYITNGNKVIYLDWSIPEEKNLIIDCYREEK